MQALHIVLGNEDFVFAWQAQILPKKGDIVRARYTDREIQGRLIETEWYYSISNNDVVVILHLERIPVR